MDDRVKTKVEQELEDAQARHDDDPERANLLRVARQFKASWIELAESLTETRKNGSWKKWGFASFDEYAKKELHLRQETVDKLALAGVPLATAPNDIYYEMLDTRLPGHGHNIAELQTRGILLDGTTEGGEPRLLLQIFSQPSLGPVFFEFIQRQGNYSEGFGEGNFKALFESLERDQIRRGVLEAA